MNENIISPENLVYKKPELMNDTLMHYCPGCSHGVVHKLVAEVIEDMGMDNTSKIKKDAAIAKAESERDVAIAEAQAKKAANDARVEAETQIAEKNNQLAIKQSQLKISADMKKAEADAAYKIQEQEQRRTIEVNSVNADIARQEREAELKKVEVQVTEQALDAALVLTGPRRAKAGEILRQRRRQVAGVKTPAVILSKTHFAR